LHKQVRNRGDRDPGSWPPEVLQTPRPRLRPVPWMSVCRKYHFIWCMYSMRFYFVVSTILQLVCACLLGHKMTTDHIGDNTQKGENELLCNEIFYGASKCIVYLSLLNREMFQRNNNCARLKLRMFWTTCLFCAAWKCFEIVVFRIVITQKHCLL
jgi:hypothetical protein